MAYRRRVQVTGGGTFLVTLPKEWADAVGVTQGTSMLLVPGDSGSLILVPLENRSKNRCRIALDGRDPVHVRRDIIARYIAGYDVIEVVGDRIRPEQRRSVREIAQSLVGLEVMGETHGAVTLHCVVNARDFPVEGTVRRIFDITLGMWEDGIAAFTARDEELAQDVVERDGDVDRLVLLVARQFGLLLRDLVGEEDMQLSRFACFHYHTVADQLERVADHAAKVSRATVHLAAALTPSLAEGVGEAAQASREILTRAVQAFEQRDGQLANQVLEGKERQENLLAWAQSAIREQPKNAFPLSIVMDSVYRSREYGFNIAEVALDAAVPVGQRNHVPPGNS